MAAKGGKEGAQALSPSYKDTTYHPPKFHYKVLPLEKQDFFLVLDFEGVTKEKRRPCDIMEIIEFPVLKINARTFETESIFHSYVQPTVYPKLNPFVTEITGITIEMVEGQPTLPEVLIMLDGWLKTEGLLEEGVKCCFVTCGDWDLKTALPVNCDYLKIPYNDCLKRWINIKNYFQDILGKKPPGMKGMLQDLHLNLDGKHHSGIDDSKNIAKILRDLAGRNEQLGKGIVAPKVLVRS